MNVRWLVCGKFFRLILSFFVGIFIARYLGPANLGIISYAMSLRSLFSIFIYLGLGGLVTRELVQYPQKTELTLGTTFFLKTIGSLMGFLILLTMSLSNLISNKNEALAILIIGLSLFPSALDCIDFWFESKIEAKFIVISQNIALMVTSILKILFIITKANLIFFFIAFSIEYFIQAFFITYFYAKKGGKFFKWRASFNEAQKLLKESWMVMLSGLFALIYLKMDLIMLRLMIGPDEVGIYAIASHISETWYLIPNAIASSIFPKLIKIHQENRKDFEKEIQKYFSIFFSISLAIAILTQMFAGIIIPLAYGSKYMGSISILKIHIWAGIFMFQRTLLSKWFIIEKCLKFSLFGAAVGALVNIMLNFALIPILRGPGAAIATLLSYATSSYFVLFLHPKTRHLGVSITKSFLCLFKKIYIL